MTIISPEPRNPAWPNLGGWITTPAHTGEKMQKPKNLTLLLVNGIEFDPDDVTGLAYDPHTKQVTLVLKVWSMSVEQTHEGS